MAFALKTLNFCQKALLFFPLKFRNLLMGAWKDATKIADSAVGTHNFRVPNSGDTRNLYYTRNQRFCKIELCASLAVWEKEKQTPTTELKKFIRKTFVAETYKIFDFCTLTWKVQYFQVSSLLTEHLKRNSLILSFSRQFDCLRKMPFLLT